jgi:hypothetical protein
MIKENILTEEGWNTVCWLLEDSFILQSIEVYVQTQEIRPAKIASISCI